MRLLSSIVLVALLAASAMPRAEEIGLREMAAYRLTLPEFERFVRASRSIVEVTLTDPRFRDAPLFTKEVAVFGDAALTATALAKRLEADPELAAALQKARMTAREYAMFAVVLFAARMAHGFVSTGVLRDVPAGVPADNVAFVAAHAPRIAALLKEIGVADE
jgi:hypothetical protein